MSSRPRDPRVAEFVAAIEGVSLTRYDRVTFEDQDIWLDGGEYIDCVFTDCRITVELGMFKMSGNNRFDNCKWRGGVPANRWLALTDYLRGLTHSDGRTN